MIVELFRMGVGVLDGFLRFIILFLIFIASSLIPWRLNKS